MRNHHDLDIGDDLVITKTTRRAAGGGTWVIGTIAGHQFHALVFPEHAECPGFEMGDIIREVATRGKDSRFKKVGRGKFVHA